MLTMFEYRNNQWGIEIEMLIEDDTKRVTTFYPVIRWNNDLYSSLDKAEGQPARSLGNSCYQVSTGATVVISDKPTFHECVDVKRTKRGQKSKV